MDERFKKVCAYGALITIIYGLISLRKDYFYGKYDHLPTENRSTTTSIAVRSVSISGISTSATTTQPPQYQYMM